MWDRKPSLRQAGISLPAAGAAAVQIKVQATLTCVGWVFDWSTTGGAPTTQRYHVAVTVQVPGLTIPRTLVKQADLDPAGRLVLPFSSATLTISADPDNAGTPPILSYAAHPLHASDDLQGIGPRELQWVEAAAGTTASETLTVPAGAIGWRPVQGIASASADYNRQRNNLGGGGAWVDAGGVKVASNAAVSPGQALGEWLPIGPKDRVEIAVVSTGTQRWVEWLYRW
jgi:hypothetical protein